MQSSWSPSYQIGKIFTFKGQANATGPQTIAKWANKSSVNPPHLTYSSKLSVENVLETLGFAYLPSASGYFMLDELA